MLYSIVYSLNFNLIIMIVCKYIVTRVLLRILFFNDNNSGLLSNLISWVYIVSSKTYNSDLPELKASKADSLS